MKSIYKNIFKIISKVLYLIPFAGRFLTMLFPFINQFIDFIFSISGKLFEFAYKSIRATLFQIQETQADKESALIFGNDTMRIFFEEFPSWFHLAALTVSRLAAGVQTFKVRVIFCV
jgi:hypothetical protein